MYILITRFSNDYPTPMKGSAPEVEAQPYETYADAMNAMDRVTKSDLESLNTDKHPANLIIDTVNGCARLEIEYQEGTEYIQYEIYQTKTIDMPDKATKNHTLKQYTVSIAVDARADVTVMARDPGHAKKLAEEGFMEFPCGDLEIVTAKPVNCTDEDDDVTDY